MNNRVLREYRAAFEDEDSRRREWASAKLVPDGAISISSSCASGGQRAQPHACWADPDSHKLGRWKRRQRSTSSPRPRPGLRIPYKPRPHFVPLHASDKRFMFVVAHRRAGKTVALVNHLIRAANLNPRPTPPPRYAYIGPSFDAAKDLVWGYLKHYTANIPGIRTMEGELSVTLPNQAQIRLYGGALAYERMRGIYLDGAVLDEYPLLHPNAFTSVVRPCLADYRGFAIVSGTAAGEDHFHALKFRAEEDPNWAIFDIPITATGDSALNPEEVQEMRQDMSPDEFAREMLCSFAAPVEGAYYQEAINSLQTQNRVTKVSPDLNTGSDQLGPWDAASAGDLVVPDLRPGVALDRLH